MKTAAYVVSGLAAGVFSGALGLGGALIATPLIRFLGVSPFLAIGSTVPVLFPTTLTGAYTYRRSGFVDVHATIWMALGGIPGTVAGALLTHRVPGRGHLLMLLTAGFLFVLSIRMIRRPESAQSAASGEQGRAGLFALGLAAGGFSGLLGVGGGFLLVPGMLRFFRMPVKTVLGTSLAVIAVITIPNTIAQQIAGNIDWKVALGLAIGVIPGARIGARLAIRAPENTLRIVVGLAIAVVSTLYAALEIAALSSR